MAARYGVRRPGRDARRGSQNRNAANPETTSSGAPREAHTDIAAENEPGRINMLAIEMK
ncbi:hypothetical protein [Burkholderia perseverans]|uniref:hypothetical protein n=1 Tax=Burkholderia perseverans TaxID=2615214 RepID=UPI001FEF55AB|nr:hypothetical protein [Burkholderia perseverans]